MKGVRAWILETALVAVGSLLLVAAAVSALPDASGQGWAERFGALFSAANYGWSPALKAELPAQLLRLSGRSLAVVAGALATVLAIGIPVGVWAAVRPRDRTVRLLRGALDRGSGIPVLVWTIVLFDVAWRDFGVLLRADAHFAGAAIASVAVLAFGDHLLGDVIGRVADAARETREEPHMRTVRVARFGETRHLLRGLVAPLANLVAARGVFLVSATTITERIFDIRGLGWYVAETLGSIRADPPLLLATGAALITITSGLRVLQGMALAFADPRLRG